MIFIIVELAVSAMVLWAFSKSRLEVLGILPKKSRIIDFTFGLFTSAVICAAYLLLVVLVSGTSLSRNPDFTTMAFFKGAYWTLKSVLTEELLFRGALLIIAVRLFGLRNACLLSATAFGIYHWFSYEIFGNVQQMIYVFVLTAVVGFVFAYSFMATGSLYLPVGLHLGWNFVNVVVFSEGPLGEQMLLADGGQPLGKLWSVFFFIYQLTLMPFVTFLYLRKHEEIGFDAQR